tara:strand:+ start:172 stop:558 length:387 start_codon:yes stop_codon:yes gene_type:complete
MSTLKVNTLQDASGGNSSTAEQIAQGRAKVWANLDGIGTIALRDSFNISSVTDTATGKYTFNFATAMPNANYSFQATAGETFNLDAYVEHTGVPHVLTGSIMITCRYSSIDNAHERDSEHVCIAIFGD